MIVCVAAAFSQGADPFSRYVAHLGDAQLPTVRLLELTIGDRQPEAGVHSIPQDRDVPITLTLSPSGITENRIAIRVRVSGVAGRAEQTYWISTEDWELGGTYSWSGAFVVPAMAVSGPSTLTVGELLPKTTAEIPLGNGADIPIDEALLFRGPSFVHPAVTTSRVGRDVIDATFGPEARRIGQAFRLAPNTSVQIHVDLLPGEQCVGVGIISSLTGGFDFDQGDDVVLISTDSSSEMLNVRAGVDTSFIDAAVPPPGVVQLNPVRALEEQRAPFVNWQKAAVKGAIYSSTLRFDTPQDLKSITCRYVAHSGCIDVHDIVYLVRQSSPAVR